MESINFIKGYGKVNPIEEAPNSLPITHFKNPNSAATATVTHKRRRVVAVTFLILLTLFIAAVIGAFVHTSTTDESGKPSSLAAKSSESLRTVCAVTQHQDSCFSSISAVNNPPESDPVRFFNLSMQVTMQEVSDLKSLPKNLIPKSNDLRAESALKDCLTLFDDSASQLSRSFELMKAGPGEKVFTAMTINDMQTWISAAMTDQDTCLEGLEEMGTTVLGEFKVRAQRSQEYMSNTLAILNNLQSLCEKFGHTLP